ncbi:MAG: succinate dehydrogenase assembly factor 2 [Pelagibacterales bacterium]|nr:succinate dehydrogenase assembly factor 2 [Pelagibacterales bacterium]
MNKEILTKQVLYRSIHRGCKETDILLGKFAEAKVAEFSDDKLNLYHHFIEEDDMMIYDWILSKANFPSKYSELISEIRDFHNLN